MLPQIQLGIHLDPCIDVNTDMHKLLEICVEIFLGI
jgi:hypothetical protein